MSVHLSIHMSVHMFIHTSVLWQDGSILGHQEDGFTNGNTPDDVGTQLRWCGKTLDDLKRFLDMVTYIVIVMA